MTTNKIVNFLRTRPLISVNALEKQCDLSQGTISKAVAGLRSIPEHHFEIIEFALKKYGLK